MLVLAGNSPSMPFVALFSPLLGEDAKIPTASTNKAPSPSEVGSSSEVDRVAHRRVKKLHYLKSIKRTSLSIHALS